MSCDVTRLVSFLAYRVIPPLAEGGLFSLEGEFKPGTCPYRTCRGQNSIQQSGQSVAVRWERDPLAGGCDLGSGKAILVDASRSKEDATAREMTPPWNFPGRLTSSPTAYRQFAPSRPR